MGNREDGADSLASQVKPASHWPGMRVLIAVVSGENTKRVAVTGQHPFRHNYNNSPWYFVHPSNWSITQT